MRPNRLRRVRCRRCCAWSTAAPRRARRCRGRCPWACRWCRRCTARTAGRSRRRAPGRRARASAISSRQSMVAARERLAGALLALQDDARGRGVFGDVECGVEHRLVVDGARRLDAARRRDDDGRPRVVDARGEFVRGEPAEHHRMHRAEPCARQHRDHRLGHHRHVDDDAVALADAEARAARRRSARSRPAVRGRCRCACEPVTGES